jgi:pyruvyltransferase
VLVVRLLFLFLFFLQSIYAHSDAYHLEGLPVCYWKKKGNENFGDYLSLKLVERIVGGQVAIANNKDDDSQPKLLAIGSILILANDGDVVWGTGMNGKRMD